MNKQLLLSVVLLMTGTWLLAQEQNRFMVFFTDKDNSEYSVNNPLEYLSERSLYRRNKYNIPVTREDLPVNSSYLNEVREAGALVFYQTRWLNGILVQCENSLVDRITAMEFVERVEWVSPGAMSTTRNYGFQDDFEPARVKQQSNLTQNSMLGIDAMHADGFTGENMMIAVFDAGFTGVENSIYFDHLRTNGQITGTYNFLDNSTDVYHTDSHGTEVLSIMGAWKPDEYIGISWSSDYILCITEDIPGEYRIEEYNWLFAAEFADSLGVDIINTSLGYNLFDEPSMNYSYLDMDGNTAVITRAHDLAARRGILCVASVGNEGNDAWKKLVAPADADSILSVGAVNSSLQYVNFSSKGPSSDGRIKPEVSALGSNTSVVSSTGPGLANGTSYAAPLIAGLAAGIWQAYPELNPMEIIELIKRGSSAYVNPDTLIGYGVPDYRKIKNIITSLEENLPENIFHVYPNPVKFKRLFIDCNGGLIGNFLEIRLYDKKGSLAYENNLLVPEKIPSVELDLQKLIGGVYILNLVSGSYSGNVKLLIP